MELQVSDFEATWTVRKAVSLPRNPGSGFHGRLKAALSAVDPESFARLLNPVAPDPSPHWSLKPGATAPPALVPVLREFAPKALAEGDAYTLGIRCFGPLEPSTERSITDALEQLDDRFALQRIGRVGPRERRVTVGQPVPGRGDLEVRFMTPAHLARRGRVTADLDFESLLTHVSRRVELVCAFYGTLAPDAAERFQVLREATVDVVAQEVALRVVSWRRRESGNEDGHSLHGLVGSAAYVGPVMAVAPLFEVAEVTHVGKQTSMGLGQVRFRWRPAEGAVEE